MVCPAVKGLIQCAGDIKTPFFRRSFLFQHLGRILMSWDVFRPQASRCCTHFGNLAVEPLKHHKLLRSDQKISENSFSNNEFCWKRWVVRKCGGPLAVSAALSSWKTLERRFSHTARSLCDWDQCVGWLSITCLICTFVVVCDDEVLLACSLFAVLCGFEILAEIDTLPVRNIRRKHQALSMSQLSGLIRVKWEIMSS